LQEFVPDILAELKRSTLVKASDSTVAKSWASWNLCTATLIHRDIKPSNLIDSRMVVGPD